METISSDIVESVYNVAPWTRMTILDSIIPKGWYFYRKRSIIFSKSRRDDIITNQEKMYLLKKLERIDGIIISPILGSSFCYWIYSIIMTTLRVYFDKKSSWIQLVQISMKDFYKQYSRIITINVLILIL